MKLNKIIFVSVMLIAGLFVAPTDLIAGKPDRCSPWPACKDDSGDPPPPEPPSTCADTFPGFVHNWGARNALDEIRLASSEGCRSEIIATMPELRGLAFHMTADGSKGVIVWAEDFDNQYLVRRLDFTMDYSLDPNGVLVFGDPVTILPLAGEEPIVGEDHYFEVGDVWGDATHGSLYLAVLQNQQPGSGPDAGKNVQDALIYDLNVLTDNSPVPAFAVHTIYHHLRPLSGHTPEVSEWLDATNHMTLEECSTVLYHQFSPTCHSVAGPMRFNSSGTRLYIELGGRPDLEDPEVESWAGVVRIETSDIAAGVALADWNLGGPEMIFANNLINGSTGEPTAAFPRPGTDPYVRPDPEIISAGGGEFLNADQCVAIYADYASGMLLGSSDLWQACTSLDILVQGDGGSWESPNSYLFSRVEKRRRQIYRYYVSGGMDGTEQKILEGGFPDTGL